MKARDLIERLQQWPQEAEVLAIDPETLEPCSVTGLLYTPGQHPTIELQTDEP